MGKGKKRKTSPLEEPEDTNNKRRFIETETAESEPLQAVDEPEETTTTQPTKAQAVEDTTPIESEQSEPAPSTATSKAEERMARFKALREKQAAGRKHNRKETQLESQRQGRDPNLLNALQRKQAIAQQKLLKADTEDAGEDFERKRAWDWTIEESEAWDRRMEKKEKHRQNVAFQDYTQEARKAYKRQMRDFKPDLEAYEKEKVEAIEKAAANGGLEIVETETGELIAVDRDGSFYSTEDSTSFVNNKPTKEAVDRLVAEIQRAEDVRLKKRRERARKNGEDEGDVTYINLKNKQFNEKLRRFYDKYTSDIRDSFERGTAI